jgi:hypothetical protein
MTTRPVIDAGPALNFFSIHQERLLLSVLGRVHVVHNRRILSNIGSSTTETGRSCPGGPRPKEGGRTR